MGNLNGKEEMMAWIVRNAQGERRVSGALYRLLLTTHIILSVGWLGVVVAKLALAMVAMNAGPGASSAMFASMDVLNRVFPPAAIGTFVTGVTLGLGTKWGLVQHYWVAVKMVLTVAVPATAVQIGDRLMQPAATQVGSAATLLVALSVAHLLMLGAATVLSVYRPWGLTPFGRRAAAAGRRRATQARPPSANRSLSPT
jgi:hypothetical protein